MIRSMSIFYDQLRGTGKVNRINLIDLERSFPALYTEMKNSKSRDMTDWVALGVDEKKLATFYNKISPMMVNEVLSANQNLTFFRELRKCNYAEKCKYNFTYLSVFSSACSILQRFPTINEYWKYWVQKNHSAIVDELNEQLSYSAISRKMAETGDSYEKCKSSFLKGLELRAKRFYCAAIREVDTMLAVAQSIPNEFEGYEVFTHPLIDSVCKYDAIVLTPEGEAVALAICLESDFSHQNVRRKSDQIPDYFKPLVDRAVGFDISMKKYDTGITIANSQEKEDLRFAISGNPYKIKLMNAKYTWKKEKKA